MSGTKGQGAGQVVDVHVEELQGGCKAQRGERPRARCLRPWPPPPWIMKSLPSAVQKRAVPQEKRGRVRLQGSNRLLAALHIGLERFLTNLFTEKNVLVVEKTSVLNLTRT